MGLSVTKTVKLLNLCFEKNLRQVGSFENPSELTNDIGKWTACLLERHRLIHGGFSIVMLVFGKVNPWNNSTEVLVGHQGQMII